MSINFEFSSFAILVQWVAEEAPQLDLLMSIGGIEKRT